jgi:integrase
MGKCESKGRKKETRNANRMDGASTRQLRALPRFPRPDDEARSYALRHTAPMLPGQSGTDAKTAQGLMGHADARTTLKIYTHFEEERAREAVSRLDGFLGGISRSK